MKIILAQTNYPTFLNDFYKKNPKIKNKSFETIKSYWSKEMFGSSDFYMQNLKPLGWSGTELILNDWIMQSKWMEENGFKIKHPNHPLSKFLPPRIKNLLGLNGWMKEAFFRQVETLNPDVLYIHDLTLLNKADLKFLKNHTRLLVGQIAYPLPLNQGVLGSYDLIISSFPHFVDKFRSMGIKSEYLRWCSDHRIPKVIGKKIRKYNVSYVGGFTPHHSNGNSVFEKVAEKIKVDFWGYGESFLMPGSFIKRNFHGNAWGRKMYEIFASSKIVINRHINISEGYANNMRMFDATIMGALLITDHKKNMNEFFEVGREVVTYKNADDLIKKINYYIKNPLELNKIALAGQKRTLKSHTYKSRMKELDIILKKYLKK